MRLNDGYLAFCRVCCFYMHSKIPVKYRSWISEWLTSCRYVVFWFGMSWYVDVLLNIYLLLIYVDANMAHHPTQDVFFFLVFVKTVSSLYYFILHKYAAYIYVYITYTSYILYIRMQNILHKCILHILRICYI